MYIIDMERITATEFRKQVLLVLEAVQRGITYSTLLKGVEVAVLSPPATKAFPIGMLAGKGWISPDFNYEISCLEEA